MPSIVNLEPTPDLVNGINGRGKWRQGRTFTVGGKTTVIAPDVTNQVVASPDDK